VNELSEQEQVIFCGLTKNDSQASTTGTNFSGKKCVTCQFFQPNRYPESDRPHHCALVNAPFVIAIFVSTAEHLAADPETAQQNWNLYLSKWVNQMLKTESVAGSLLDRAN